MKGQLTATEARRVALAAQGFADPRPRGRVDVRHLRRVLRRVGLLQLDSVNVVARSHYLPLFSRLGPYPQPLLDDVAYRRRELFEYWGHEASLIPVSHFSLFRHRMAAMRPWGRVARVMAEHPGYIESVHREVARRGPLAGSELADPGRRSGPWWGLAKGATALEWLFASGRLAVHERRNFVRRYDLVERVLPEQVVMEALPRVEARRRLLRLAAATMGVASAAELADYYRLPIRAVRAMLPDLVRAGELAEVTVAGWREPAYLHPQARLPRRVETRALLSPFDSLIWHRPRTERLFGFHYRIEIYVPAAQRRYGYYVLPFLLGDRLVARVDLKADRRAGALLVRGAFSEDGLERPRIATELASELEDMAEWLGLGRIEVAKRGNLAAPLRGACH